MVQWHIGRSGWVPGCRRVAVRDGALAPRSLSCIHGATLGHIQARSCLGRRLCPECARTRHTASHRLRVRGMDVCCGAVAVVLLPCCTSGSIEALASHILCRNIGSPNHHELAVWSHRDTGKSL